MKNFYPSLVLAAGALLAPFHASAAVVLVFAPSASHVNVGDSLTIDVSISGLGAEVVSGFDLNFIYNPTALNFQSGTYFASQLGNQTPLNQVNTAGNLGVDVVSLDDDAVLAGNQLDAFLLFQWQFEGVADGVSSFTLGADPDFERLFSGLGANPLMVNVGTICISVGTGQCTVPEPNTYGLVGLALAAATLPAALRRRRKF